MKIRLSIEPKSIRAFVDKIISKYHFDEDDREEIAAVYGKMQLCMSPYAIYKINQRVTGNKEIDGTQTALVAMTLGANIDKLQERYEKSGELDQAYILDCLANELLLNMYTEFNNSYAKFHRRYVSRYHFLGKDIALEKIPGLLEELYQKSSDEAIENSEDTISANEYGTLTPSKSVIFYALLSENPTTVCEGICIGCGNLDCENRVVKTKEPAEQLGKEKPNPLPAMKYSYGYQRIFGN